MTATETSPDFHPMVPPHRDDPHLYYRAARACPVAQSPSFGTFMVSRYDDVRAVIDDPVTFSSAAALPSIYANPPEVVAELEGRVPETTLLVNEDLPGHTATRAVFEAGFSGARVRALLPTIRARALELVEAFDPAGADLVVGYADPLVETITNTAIGFPAEDAERIRAWTEDVTLLWNPIAPVDGKVAAAVAMRDYTDYLQALIEARRAEPRDDLTSDLVHGTADHPAVSDAMAQNLVRGARVAGHDTTKDAITSSMLVMLQNPQIWAAVAAGEPRLVSKVIEETLRRDAPHRGLMRITTREVELGGTTLPAGAPLLLLFGSANRDEAKFPHPDTVDLERANVRDHLAFGTGMHVCPGAPLARAETRIALETLVQQRPGMRLAEGYEPCYVASYFFRGLQSLPVMW